MLPFAAASGAAVGSASFCIPARVNQTAGRSAAPSLLSLSLPLLNRLVPTFQPGIKCTRSVYGDKTCAQYLFVILSQPDAHIIKLRDGIRRFEIFYIRAAVFLPHRHLCLQTTSRRRPPPSGRAAASHRRLRGLRVDGRWLRCVDNNVLTCCCIIREISKQLHAPVVEEVFTLLD